MTSPDWYRPPAAEVGAQSLEAWQPQPEDTVGFWPRAFARIIDGVAAAVIAFVTVFVCKLLRVAGVPLPTIAFTIWESLLFSFVLSSSGHVLAEAVGGATPGKYMLGLRVRRVDGAMCTFGAALKRQILYLWDAFFFAVIAYSAITSSSLKQRTGDRWAGTVVVRNGAMPAGARAGQRAMLGAMIYVAIYFGYNVFVPTP